MALTKTPLIPGRVRLRMEQQTHLANQIARLKQERDALDQRIEILWKELALLDYGGKID